jgi:tetratricopeptide (TPR) repeat protein
MIENPPPRPSGPAHELDFVELRVANLRRELGAETEPRSRAAILYQIGALYEHDLGRVPDAIEQYAQAHAAAPDFHPALIAQLRITERETNRHDVAALRSEHVATATSAAVANAALVDLAIHSEDWASLLREAVAQSPEPVVPALILEWLAEARGDQEAVRHALRAQANHATDATLRAAIWIDVALSDMDAGDPDAAIEALERACECDALAWQARSLQRRTATEHERWEVLVRAAVSMAGLLEAAVGAEDPADPLDLSVPVQERLPMAAFLWQEAAACSATHLDDPGAAAEYIDRALRLFPDRRTTRLQALLLQERSDDPAALEDASDWFRSTAPEDPTFVAHEVRRALLGDDLQVAVDTLRDAVARYPDSAYAQAALDVALIRSAEPSARAEQAERLRVRAEAAEEETRARLSWHAAQLTASGADASTQAQAQALYSEASHAATRSKERILREALGEALVSKQPDLILRRCEELLECDIEPAERSTLAFTRYDVTQNTLRASQDAQLLLRDGLEDPNNHGWAPHVARAQAAWTGNAALLARAHETIAELTTGDVQIGHLCAAGQAHARDRNWDAAERALRQARGAAPDDRYIVTLLDGVLREGGRPEDVVSLARERSKGEPGAALGELSLLLAGATAERAGNLTAAQHAYEQALLESPGSLSAALALLDVARRQDDTHTRLRAYAHLSDADVGGGVPQLYALLRGDTLRDGGNADAGEAYERALEHPTTALFAAVALLSTPTRLATADQRSAAEEVLADAEPAHPEAARGFAAAYGALRASLGQEGASASDAWLQLATLAPTDDLRAGALLQGLRDARIAEGTDTADELFMLAQEADELAESHPDAAVVIEEALTPDDDAEFRASALDKKLRHSASVGLGALDAAHCRALVDAERGAEAVTLLSSATDARPDDLALWETLRGAARQAQQWPLVAQACERLSPFVDGSLRADLLEEAGVVRLACLGQYQQAEDLFRRALAEDPTRDIAFRRLHDLLAEQEDAEALEALVSDRLALGGPKDRLDLLYERARLLRGFSDRPGALEVLGELFTAEPEHPGALALAAEVHVSLEQWAEAVDCLQRLSKASIPEEQRRVAHLGAADFLETHLDSKEAALEELRAIEALGLADAQIWTRIGALETGFDNRGAAIDAYRRALEAEPIHAFAISSLVDLIDETDKAATVASYEVAIWAGIDGRELDAALLDGLRNAATWRGQTKRAAAARTVQSVLGLGPSSDVGDAVELGNVSVATIRDPDANSVLQEVVVRAGPALSRDRLRSNKATPNDPVYAELEQLSQRFGARVGSIGISDDVGTVIARTGRDAEIEWVVPRHAQHGLDGPGRFVAGRLAWAAPHGAAALLDDSPERIAGTLAAILRVARCNVAHGEPALPAVHVKLRRAVRKSVNEAAGDTTLTPSSLLSFARSLQRSADRAGLLASGDIAGGFETLLSGKVTLDALKTSARGLDLLRFWLDADSALWGRNG